MITVFLCVTSHTLSYKYQHFREVAASITWHYSLGCENLVCHLAECFNWPWVLATHILNVWRFTSISHASSCRGYHDSSNFISTSKKRTLISVL